MNILFILSLLIILILLFLTHKMKSFVVPIFIAFFTSLVIQPFIEKLYKTKVPNWLSTVIVITSAILLVAILLTIFGLSFGSFVIDFTKSGGIADNFQSNLVNFVKDLSKIEFIKKYVDQERINQIIFDLAAAIFSIENFKNYIVAPLGKTIDALRSFGLYALALIFILPGMGKISYRISDSFPGDYGNKINEIIINIKRQIQNYMVAKTIISLITALISFIILILFRVKYAFLWSFIIFLLNYIPILGSIIAVMFPIMISFVQYQNTLHLIFLSICLIVVQIVIGNIIEPKFMSKGVNLTPLIIFVSLLVWGFVWGIVGVFLAVPLMSAVNSICQNIEFLKPISKMISIKPKENIKR
ncbi:MAG: AI-2E family transporter [Spirochaetes bacterium]|nr:AI-2E family transporter [Spirochaetota bacterium]